jgi:hypothetical protein
MTFSRAAVTALLLAAVVVAAPRTARAERDAPPRPLGWSPEWPRFRGAEYAGTLLLGAATLTLQFAARPPSTPRWSGGLLFDDFARRHLRAGTPAGRDRARAVS